MDTLTEGAGKVSIRGWSTDGHAFSKDYCYFDIHIEDQGLISMAAPDITYLQTG